MYLRDRLGKRHVIGAVLILCTLTIAIYIAGCAVPETPRNAYFSSTASESAAKTGSDKPAAPAAPSTPAVLPGKANANDNRLRVYTGELTLSAANRDYAVSEIHKLTENLGGYFEVAQNDLLIIRVPAQNFQALVGGLPVIGEVSDSNITVLDVTDEFCDMKAKLKNLQAVRDRLQALLKNANDIPDTIRIEQELNRVQTQIDMLTGQIERLSRQIAYAKLTIRLVTPGTSPISKQVRDFTPAYWVEQMGLENLYR